MKRFFLSAIMVSLATAAPVAAEPSPLPAPVSVPPSPASVDARQAVDPAYYTMFEQLYGGVDQAAMRAGIIKATIALMKRNSPEIAAMIATQPLLEGKLAAVIGPVMVQHQKNLFPVQREETAHFIARYLSPAEARSMTAFYVSPLGHKALGIASRQTSFANALEGASQTGEVSAADLSKDLHRGASNAGREIVSKASPAEMRQIIALMRTSAYAHFMLMMRDMPAFRASLENLPMDPALEAKAQADIAEVLLDAKEAAAKKP